MIILNYEISVFSLLSIDYNLIKSLKKLGETLNLLLKINEQVEKEEDELSLVSIVNRIRKYNK